MKKLLIYFLLAPLLSFGQNRFGPLFTEADSAFLSLAKHASEEAALQTGIILQIKPCSDERMIYRMICEVLDSDTTRYQGSVRESMYSYFSGYLAGLTNSGELKNVDFRKFLIDIKNEKRALKAWIRIKKTLQNEQSKRQTQSGGKQ